MSLEPAWPRSRTVRVHRRAWEGAAGPVEIWNSGDEPLFDRHSGEERLRFDLTEGRFFFGKETAYLCYIRGSPDSARICLSRLMFWRAMKSCTAGLIRPGLRYISLFLAFAGAATQSRSVKE